MYDLRNTGNKDQHGKAIWEMPEPTAIFAGELLKRATEYLDAFHDIVATHPNTKSHAAYFLAAHSLELYLKSHLVSVGDRTKDQIRKLGHKLGPIFEHCLRTGLPDVQDLPNFVNAMSEMNSDHDFRYPSGYRLHVPNPGLCEGVLARLRDAVSPSISQAALRGNLEFASNTRHLQGSVIRWSD